MVVRNLRVTYAPEPPISTELIAGIDLDLPRGRRLALVGESGSGKSLTALAIMGLIDHPLSVDVDELSVHGRDLHSVSARTWRGVRGSQVALVQQDSLTALSPFFTVENQLGEALRRQRLSKREARAESLRRLAEVGIPDPARRAKSYPHQLSGGLRQRVAIAVALAGDPSILLADEPTTALDVTVQAQILELLRRLSDERGMSLVFVTHDLGLLPGFVHEIAVMYSGRIVERGPVDSVLSDPRHPYTCALVAAQPGRLPGQPRRPLASIPGVPPAPSQRPSGCAFRTRCPHAADVCAATTPVLAGLDGRLTSCHFPRPALRGPDPRGLR
jgi:oligopeptide/dipeptide ABC transporter ATP-binding protein